MGKKAAYKSSFYLKVNKSLDKYHSPSQELEEGPHSRMYLLVISLSMTGREIQGKPGRPRKSFTISPSGFFMERSFPKNMRILKSYQD